MSFTRREMTKIGGIRSTISFEMCIKTEDAEVGGLEADARVDASTLTGISAADREVVHEVQSTDRST